MYSNLARNFITSWPALCVGALLVILATGCEPAEEETEVKEKKPAKPRIAENGRMTLEVNGQNRQVYYNLCRFLNKGDSFPDTLVIYGKNVELYGEFDVNEDGETTAEDQLADSTNLTELGEAMLNKPLLLRPNPPQHEPRVVLPELGLTYLVSGKIVPQQFTPATMTEAANWNGTVDLVLEDQEGEEHQVYGEIQGTMVTGEVRMAFVDRLRATAEDEAEAREQAQVDADADSTAAAPEAP
jgi:hypothetical protein